MIFPKIITKFWECQKIRATRKKRIFRKINDAHEILGNPKLKKIYDKMRENISRIVTENSVVDFAKKNKKDVFKILHENLGELTAEIFIKKILEKSAENFYYYFLNFEKLITDLSAENLLKISEIPAKKFWRGI